MTVTIRQATKQDEDWMQAGFDQFMGWTKPAGYFAHACALHEAGAITLFAAADGDAYVGHVKVAWEAGYPYFRENNIPDIQDLNVRPDYRRQGVASRLIDAAEAVIRERSPIAGIGFGLYADYGSAQRLYIKRGYVPDGRGVMYDDQPVPPGEARPVDDDLVLYLTRRL